MCKHKYAFKTDSRNKPVFTLNVIDSAPTQLYKTEANVDRYTGSGSYKDVEVNINTALNRRL